MHVPAVQNIHASLDRRHRADGRRGRGAAASRDAAPRRLFRALGRARGASPASALDARQVRGLVRPDLADTALRRRAVWAVRLLPRAHRLLRHVLRPVCRRAALPQGRVLDLCLLLECVPTLVPGTVCGRSLRRAAVRDPHKPALVPPM